MPPGRKGSFARGMSRKEAGALAWFAGVTMRFEFAALLIAFSLLLAGCIGSGEPAKSENGTSIGNGSGIAAQEEPSAAQQPEEPPAPAPEAATPGETAKPKAGNATKPDYTNYCYTTYWKGMLNGTGRNYLEFDRCGNYNYSMEISVAFTVPFDLAAYLAGKDFNFNDCPGMPLGAANGSRDISIDGNFRSVREITSQVVNRVDRLPDMQTSSDGALYISQPSGLVFATYPRQGAQGHEGKYPHMVVDRCTWEDGILARGYDEAMLFGKNDGGFALSGDMRTVSGRWAMNGTLAGNYTLDRTD